MGGASALLRKGRRRAPAFAALAAALTAYSFAVDTLPHLSVWWEVALLGLWVVPMVFLADLILLPLARARGLLPLAAALGVIALLAELGDLEVLANYAKLAAVTFFAFWFLHFFEDLLLIVVVALIVPWIDAYSVWRGPTGNIVEHHSEVFIRLSFAFYLPRERDDPRLGLPDLLFFGLFLAAAAKFRLRPAWTWAAMIAALVGTIAIDVWLDVGGLPALPALSIGFLVPNADLIVRRLRRARPS